MNDLFSLKGRVALVTGSTRGLGWSMARGLAAAGAHVTINGRDPAAAEAKAAELSALGFAASSEAFDTMDPAATARAIDNIVGRHGRLDILVNNAGMSHRKALEEISDDDWGKVIAQNLTSCFRLSRLVAPVMKKQRWGRIIMTSSVMSVIPRPTVSAYAAAKGGLASFTRALAAELGPHGITCNAIAPGYIATELVTALKNNPEFDSYIRKRTPAGRWGEPDELAGPAVFLASEAASYVNGHLLVVDGGMSTTL
ncbi:MAG TPA: SDR family oxidoreductase [Dongiaceae bacterium]|jgi:gluconate 5-dehydrogenase